MDSQLSCLSLKKIAKAHTEHGQIWKIKQILVLLNLIREYASKPDGVLILVLICNIQTQPIEFNFYEQVKNYFSNKLNTFQQWFSSWIFFNFSKILQIAVFLY